MVRTCYRLISDDASKTLILAPEGRELQKSRAKPTRQTTLNKINKCVFILFNLFGKKIVHRTLNRCFNQDDTRKYFL